MSRNLSTLLILTFITGSSSGIKFTRVAILRIFAPTHLRNIVKFGLKPKGPMGPLRSVSLSYASLPLLNFGEIYVISVGSLLRKRFKFGAFWFINERLIRKNRDGTNSLHTLLIATKLLVRSENYGGAKMVRTCKVWW